MSIINKPPQHVKREYELEEPVALVVEKYATFIDSTSDHVVNSAVKMLLWKDKHFMNWRKQQQQAARKELPITGTQKLQARAWFRESSTRRISSRLFWRRPRVCPSIFVCPCLW